MAGVEGFSGIHGLVVTNPVFSDDVSQGDDHIRGIKQSLKNTFPLYSATSNINGVTAYGSMYLSNSSTEFSASTSADLFTGFNTPGDVNANVTVRTASGALIALIAGHYEAQAAYCISASTNINFTGSLYVNNTDTGLHGSMLVPAQGRAAVTIVGDVSLGVNDEVRSRILATTAKLITVKDAQLKIRKLN